MQAVIAVPDQSVLRDYPDAEGVLTRPIGGVPLLVRVGATALRAGAESLLVIWPPDVDQSIWNRCAASPLLHGLEITLIARPFDPHKPSSWATIADALAEKFLWLPWNLVTHKQNIPAFVVEKPAPNRPVPPLPYPIGGVLIEPRTRTAEAEHFLVARSGKPTDGIYSRFNRWLCRPAVRILTRTDITPNSVTLGGLLVGILAALMFARGSYSAYVAGALLFFLSGLFDEADGMLARIELRESVFGTWLEGFVDEATYLLVFGGITLGLYREHGSRELIYGCLLLIGCTLSIIVTRLQRKAATSPDRPHEYAGRLNQLLETDSNLVMRIVRQIHIFIKKGVAVHYLLIFTVLGGLQLLLRLAAVGANLTWTMALYFNHRYFRRPKSGAGAVQIARETL